MSVRLGSTIRLPQPITPELAPPEPPPEWVADLRGLLALVLERLAVPAPAPQVTVEPADLSAVVTAVNGLKPNVNADEIGRAVARALAPANPEAGVSPETVERLTKVLEGLDFRMQAQPYSGGPSNERVEALLGQIASQGGGSGGGTVTQGPAGTDPWLVAVSGEVEVKNDSGSPLPVSGTVTVTPSGTQDENLKQVNGVAVNVGTGAAGTGTQRVAVATDSQLGVTQVTSPWVVSGTVTANPTTPSTLLAFITTVTTAGTRVQLASNACVAGIVEAPSTNTGIVYVGGSDVSATVFGAELQPGQSAGVAISNTNKLYVDAATSGDKLAFFGS